MPHNKLTLTLLITTLFLFSGCDMGGGSDDTPTIETSAPTVTETSTAPVETPVAEPEETVSTPSPQILASTTITSTAGQTIQVDRTPQGFIFRGYEGMIVLLEVYGDTCPHCVEAIPSYNRLQAKYPNDVVVIALESYGTLNNAGKQQYITIPKSKTGNMFSFIRDLTGYNREAVPFLMIFDRNGDKVYQKILANFPEAEIDSRIQSLL